MTESSANKPANGQVCHRVKNGVKPGRNGFIKNHHHYHHQQPMYCYPEDKVRPKRTVWMENGWMVWKW